MTKKGNRHNEFGYAERFNNWIPACGENDGLGDKGESEGNESF